MCCPAAAFRVNVLLYHVASSPVAWLMIWSVTPAASRLAATHQWRLSRKATSAVRVATAFRASVALSVYVLLALRFTPESVVPLDAVSCALSSRVSDFGVLDRLHATVTSATVEPRSACDGETVDELMPIALYRLMVPSSVMSKSPPGLTMPALSAVAIEPPSPLSANLASLAASCFALNRASRSRSMTLLVLAIVFLLICGWCWEQVVDVRVGGVDDAHVADDRVLEDDYRPLVTRAAVQCADQCGLLSVSLTVVSTSAGPAARRVTSPEGSSRSRSHAPAPAGRPCVASSGTRMVMVPSVSRSV